MKACLPAILANQQRGHLIYRGGGHHSIMADAHIIDSISMCSITVWPGLQLQNAQIDGTANTGRWVQAHEYEQINNQHGRQHCSGPALLHHRRHKKWTWNIEARALSCRQGGHGNIPHTRRTGSTCSTTSLIDF